MTTTLETFVGARLAIDRDRQEVPADLTAEDDALVNLLSGAGITDPQGRAHFVGALREHLLKTKARPDVVTTEEAKSTKTDVGSGSDTTTKGDTQSGDSVGQVVDARVVAANSGKAGLKKPPIHGHSHHGISSHGHRAFLVDDETSGGSEAKQR